LGNIFTKSAVLSLNQVQGV